MTSLADRESEIARKIVGLADRDRVGLVARWRSLYRDLPPPKLSRAFASASLQLSSRFTPRCCGVEAKLVFDDATCEIDQTLLRNLARGWVWFEEIKQGSSMEETAARSGISQRAIARLTDLALLAPDNVEAIVTGQQPCNLASNVIVRNPHHMLWRDQRANLVSQ